MISLGATDFDLHTRLKVVYHVAHFGVVLSDHMTLSSSSIKIPQRLLTLSFNPYRIVF